jgi:hypothetical protein
MLYYTNPFHWSCLWRILILARMLGNCCRTAFLLLYLSDRWVNNAQIKQPLEFPPFCLTLVYLEKMSILCLKKRMNIGSSRSNNFLLFLMILTVNLMKESADKIFPLATEVAALWMQTRFELWRSRRSNRKEIKIGNITILFRTTISDKSSFFYLICETIGTAATPGLLCQPPVIVKMIVESRWNVDWQGKPKFSEKTCPSATFVHHKIPHAWVRFRTRDRSGGKPATNRLSYGAASTWSY